MRIKQLHLKGYKRFHDVTIDLGENPARIIALVGPNGCGKSSVFDAMLFINNSFIPIGSQGNSKTYAYHSLSNNPGYDYQNVEVIFDSGEFTTVFYKRKETGVQNTIFSFRSSFRYNGSLEVRETRATSELRENNYGASSASDLDQRIEENYRRLKIKFENYMYKNDVFNETDYDNFVTDIVNQNVKDATGRIKKICGIRTSINPEVFKRNLAKCVDSSMRVYEELERVIFHRE